VYFEFLDTEVIPPHLKCNVPRISIWSSSLVSEIEMLDCVCKDKGIFGSLPVCFPFSRLSLFHTNLFFSHSHPSTIFVFLLLFIQTKDVARTPFGNLINEGQTIESNSYEDLLQFVLSTTPLESHEEVCMLLR
jgi:hypothetical protein